MLLWLIAELSLEIMVSETRRSVRCGAVIFSHVWLGMSSDPNPYSTPASIEPVASDRRANASPKLLLAFICAAIAYFVFTLILLSSTPVDRRHGVMFTWNLPIVTSMLLTAFWSRKLAGNLAFLAAASQLVIAALSRYRAIGGEITGAIIVTTPIVRVLLGLGFWAAKAPERSNAPTAP